MASVSPQPNVPGRGIVASYSVRFWILVVLILPVLGLILWFFLGPRNRGV